jgi:hypothetical protein
MAEAAASELERDTIRRVYWRLIPILFVMMFFNYLDRINLGYAGLTMNKDLGLSPAIFGFAASIFFLGYMVLEVPSNLMLHWLGGPDLAGAHPDHLGPRRHADRLRLESAQPLCDAVRPRRR